jgi:hypothetical protein
MKTLKYATFCTHLKPSHIPRVSCVFQTVLIALEEKLQEKPAKKKEVIN